MDTADSNANDNEATQQSFSSEDGTSSNDPGKMFVGGLSWQTTAEGLRDYFGKFGEVNECMVMRDPATKRARGFGFITFTDPASVDKVLAQEQHELDGKKIDPKVAFPKKAQSKMIIKTKKVFIGGLSATSTLEDMKNYFEQYGKVEDAMLMFDKTTQRHRGFGFITFDNDDVSDKVCEIHFHEINGKMVECKKAQPKEVMLPVQLNKSRAAAARSFYGLGPEQLLAYTSCFPQLNTYATNPFCSRRAFSNFLNGLQSYLHFGPTSPPASVTNGAAAAVAARAAAGVTHGFNLAAAQAAAAQQAVAFETAALYAIGGEPFAGIYPNVMQHQTPQPPPAFHTGLP